jgi:SAM-dependent methyltransferase
LIESYGWTAAVDAAQRLGIFERLRGAPSTAVELAESLDIETRSVAILLQALLVAGAVTQNGGGRYAVEPMALRIGEHWRGLEERLRRGEPDTGFDTSAGASATYGTVVADLGERAREAALLAASELAAADLDVLELAAGGVPWSLAVLERQPSCRVTAIDLATVIDATARVVAESNHSDAYTLREGDAFTVELEDESFDLVIIGGFCHLFGEEKNRALVRRAHHALRPGGRLAIIDVVPEDETNERILNFYRLSLLRRTREGQVYPFSAFAAWMSEAGLVDVDRKPLAGSPRLSLVWGRRAGR